MSLTTRRVTPTSQHVSVSRIAESGGDVSELERGLDSSQIVLTPTLAVQQGRTNPSIRYVWGVFSCVCVCMYVFIYLFMYYVCVCVCVCVVGLSDGWDT